MFFLEEQVKETTKEVEQLTLHFNKASEDEAGAKETADLVRRSARNQKGDGGDGGDGGEETAEDAAITDDTIKVVMEARLADATAYLAELEAAVELQTTKGKSVRIARMAANAKLPPASVEKKRGRFPIRVKVKKNIKRKSSHERQSFSSLCWNSRGEPVHVHPKNAPRSRNFLGMLLVVPL